MKPSILPPFTSRTDDAWVCGPPSNSTSWVTYGGTHRPSWYGSGMHTAKSPFGFVGIPSAPG
jgi:hypothetical protein